MTPDTMLAAGWPAQMVDHARAMAAVRRGAQLEVGHFVGPDKPHTPMGGPVEPEEIELALLLIGKAAAAGLPAPHVYLIPKTTTTSRVSLEWGGHGHGDDDEFCTWDIDVSLAVCGWELDAAQIYDQAGALVDISAEWLCADLVVWWLKMIRTLNRGVL